MGIQQRVSWSNTYSSVGPPSSVASEVTDRARRLCPPLGKHMVAHQALGNGVMRPGAPSARPTGHFEREGGKKDMLRAALHKMREIPEGSSREAALQSLQEWCCDRGYGKGLVHRPSTQEPASDDLSALLLHSIVSDNMAAAHLLLDQQVLGYALDVNIVSRGDGAATPTAASDAGLAAVADAALPRECTPLIAASRAGAADLVESLLRCRADPTLEVDGQSPLTAAAAVPALQAGLVPSDRGNAVLGTPDSGTAQADGRRRCRELLKSAVRRHELDVQARKAGASVPLGWDASAAGYAPPAPQDRLRIKGHLDHVRSADAVPIASHRPSQVLWSASHRPR